MTTRRPATPTARLAHLLNDEGLRVVTDWGPVLAAARTHFLLPALWAAGLASGRWSALAPDALAAIEARFPTDSAPPAVVLQRAYDANARRTADLGTQAGDIFTRLTAHGIAAVPLKGAHALIDGWWPDPAVRVMRDLDVLVPARSAAPARDALVEGGYVDVPTADRPLADHEYAVLHRPGHQATVEVQTAPLARRWPVLDAAALLAQAPLPSTTDAVIHSIAHAQLQDEAHLLRRVPLRSLYDIAKLAGSSRASEIDWDRVRRAFADIGATAALDGYLALARFYFAADVPAPSRPRRANLMAWSADALSAHRRSGQLFEKLAFQRRQLERDRLRAMYGTGSTTRLRGRHVVAGTRRTLRRR